ncbi:THAP domain-containing protein 11-like [Scleropages formosus]|uniref:THAP domain-containing protein 11 n=1 Tax=Scleropages formosus TaxID=113540 RepID=A0A0N8K1Z0_SCLFO|nr:THAP domain-containing protein 11-like [Scleropages formosus]
MPGFTCCVPGCYNNSHRDRELRFYTFPKDTAQREIWLKNISRAGVSGCFSTFQPTTGHRVCSIHFPGGRKTYSIRKLNEQRDIIALMEIKMKEMKSTIRQLKVTEAKLREEVRERDMMLSGAVARKKV